MFYAFGGVRGRGSLVLMSWMGSKGLKGRRLLTVTSSLPHGMGSPYHLLRGGGGGGRGALPAGHGPQNRLSGSQTRSWISCSVLGLPAGMQRSQLQGGDKGEAPPPPGFSAGCPPPQPELNSSTGAGNARARRAPGRAALGVLPAAGGVSGDLSLAPALPVRAAPTVCQAPF